MSVGGAEGWRWGSGACATCPGSARHVPVLTQPSFPLRCPCRMATSALSVGLLFFCCAVPAPAPAWTLCCAAQPCMRLRLLPCLGRRHGPACTCRPAFVGALRCNPDLTAPSALPPSLQCERPPPCRSFSRRSLQPCAAVLSLPLLLPLPCTLNSLRRKSHAPP